MNSVLRLNCDNAYSVWSMGETSQKNNFLMWLAGLVFRGVLVAFLRWRSRLSSLRPMRQADWLYLAGAPIERADWLK
jgi:hypothetical protein